MKLSACLTVFCATMALAANLPAVDKAELDYRVRKLTAKFTAMQSRPDKAIPAETLKQAKGIILLDRTKAGFLFAFQGGNGVALAKDPKSGEWGPAAWVGANEASLGFLIGGQQSFVAILLMTTNAANALTDANIEFGGEARGVAGDTSAGVEGKVQPNPAAVLVYDDTKGLYGGASVKAGSIAPDLEANRIYYDQFLTMREILFDGKVKITDTVSELIRTLSEQSKLARK